VQLRKLQNNLLSDISIGILFNEAVSFWSTITSSNGIQNMFHETLGFRISAAMFQLQWNL
jgi:hypothetical protein